MGEKIFTCSQCRGPSTNEHTGIGGEFLCEICWIEYIDWLNVLIYKPEENVDHQWIKEGET